MMMPIENRQRRLFIIGAPKCGTTSLASWLSGHPSVYMSPLKEPNYFCTDLPQRIDSWDSYTELFSGVMPEHTVLAEASTRYIRSKVAVLSIIEKFPEAQFVALVRNPVDMAISLHKQFLYNMVENIPEFDRAWSLQEERSKGIGVPLYCPDPRMLHYGEMCSIGKQLFNVFSLVHPKSIKVIVLEDLRDDTRKIWKELCEFIGIDDDGREHFPILNAAKRHRSRNLALLLKWMSNFKQICLPKSKSTGILRPLMSVNQVFYNRHSITSEIRIMLQEYFRDDICLLSDLLKRDLKSWLS